MKEKYVFPPGAMLPYGELEKSEYYLIDANSKEKIKDLNEKDLLWLIFDAIIKSMGAETKKIGEF